MKSRVARKLPRNNQRRIVRELIPRYKEIFRVPRLFPLHPPPHFVLGGALEHNAPVSFCSIAAVDELDLTSSRNEAKFNEEEREKERKKKEKNFFRALFRTDFS